MLLTLFRLIMIVPLLISAIYQVEANHEKLSYIPSKERRSVDGPHLRRNAALLNQDSEPDDEDSEFVDEERKVNNEQEMRSNRNTVGSMENRSSRSEVDSYGLAHKMAKDALKSPKMQETMRRLSHVKSNSPKGVGTLHATVKVPGVRIGSKLVGDRRRSKQARRNKGRRKKKRKRNHRRLRTQEAGLLKRGSSKRKSDDKRDINASTDGKTGSSLINRKQAVLDDSARGEKSKENVTVAVGVGEADYVDFSTPRNTERSVLITGPQNKEFETMVGRLMRTTTKDPSKKHQGDQGVEYSDYYSDDVVLQDIDANKIPMQLIGSSNDRIARQAINVTSGASRDRAASRINRNVHPYHAGSRKKEVRYKGDTVNTVNDFQNYPRIDRLLTRNPRVLGADDPTLGYQINYRSPNDYRNENYDASYQVAISGHVPEENGLRYNENSEPIDTKIYDPNEVQQQALDQSNYLNQYEIPGQSQSLNPSETLNTNTNTNTNEAVGPQIPQLQTFNYQPEMILSPANDVQSNTVNQPLVGNARVPDLPEENVEVHVQPSYTPPQLYGNHVERDLALKNYLIRSKYNYPSVNVPNAMDQPLGKILESLGINVNGGTNLNKNPSEDGDRQITPYAREHLISPNYLKKKEQGGSSNYYEGNDARKSEFETNKMWNRNNNIGEGYFRRHSQNAGYNAEDEERPAHMNISIAVHDTKEVANQILDTIMDELEELKADKSINYKKEGLPCRLSGSWSTAQAGVKLDMKVVNRTITVTLSERTDQPLHESLLNATWNISGHVPFKRGAPFSLTATDNSTNSIAVFVGSCRVCQGIDTIAGVWSIARQPKGCKDFQVSTTVFNDIFRKSKLSSLKEKGANSTENTTKHEKRKS